MVSTICCHFGVLGRVCVAGAFRVATSGAKFSYPGLPAYCSNADLRAASPSADWIPRAL